MGHELVKAICIPRIIDTIAKKYEISENEAIRLFYTSNTFSHYDDDETGLYGQGPLHIYSLFMEEQRIAAGGKYYSEDRLKNGPDAEKEIQAILAELQADWLKTRE